jgi:PPM family protein phosphatase
MTVSETDDALFYIDADMQSAAARLIADGTAAVISRRCPGKETPNEDAAAVVPFGDDAAVLIVADGVGGFAAGEQASKLAVEAIAESIHAAGPSDGMLRTSILNGIELANRRVREHGLGAATTLAILEIVGQEVRPYHVGDSMILSVGGRGRLKWQTIPHSPVGYGVEAGLLDEKAAMHHEDRHIVSNVIGTEDMRIEIGPTLMLAPRDTVLIATDGLCDNLLPDEIRQTVRRGPLSEAAESLMAQAQGRMNRPETQQPCKPDDLTVILFRRRMRRRTRTRKN